MKALVARGLLVAAMAGGCILPPPVSIEQGTNQRPIVLTEQVKPAAASVDLNLNCSRCTFTLQTDDPDQTDTVSTRWFLDYDDGNIDPIGFFDAPPAGGSFRSPINYPLDLQQRFPRQSDEGTTHTLDVVLSDRGFADSGQPLNRSVPAGAGVSTFRWTVKLERRGTRCDDVQNICVSDVAR